MRRLALALALVLTISGCDGTPATEPGRSPRSSDEPSPVIQERIEDATEELEEPPSSSWPDEVRSLHATIEAFTTVEECLASLRARTPTEVAEGITDLAYDGFFDDVCRSLEAVREGAAEGCDDLSVSSARRGCRFRVAVFHARPEACPEDRTGTGRDAICVAWAARDPGLCRAVPSLTQTRCRAVLAGDERACRRDRGGDRDRCAAELARYGSALGEERRESEATRRDPVLSMEVELPGADPVHIEERELGRGAKLVPTACRMRVRLGRSDLDMLPLPSLGRTRAALALEVSVPARLTLPLRLPLGATEAVLRVRTEHGTMTSVGGASGHVEITAWEPHFGGSIEGTFVGQLRHEGREVPVRGRFATFVRDVDPHPERCAAAQAE